MRERGWAALVDPRRRRVLELLRQRPHTVNELVAALGLTQPSTSKHLRVLRDAGLVRVVSDAQRRLYLIDPEPLAELDQWLAPYRRLWNARLDLLGHHLDTMAETEGRSAPAARAARPDQPAQADQPAPPEQAT